MFRFPNNQSKNNVYNIVSTKLLSAQLPVNIVTIYRAPWAFFSDTQVFFAELYKIFTTTTNVVLVSDFNIPEIDQFLCLEGKLFSRSTQGHLQALIKYHNLILINKEPTRGKVILDIVIVASSLSQSCVGQLLAVGVLIIRLK